MPVFLRLFLVPVSPLLFPVFSELLIFYPESFLLPFLLVLIFLTKNRNIDFNYNWNFLTHFVLVLGRVALPIPNLFFHKPKSHFIFYKVDISRRLEPCSNGLIYSPHISKYLSLLYPYFSPWNNIFFQSSLFLLDL